VIAEAGVDLDVQGDDTLPLRRVEVCRRLLDYFRSNDPELKDVRWDSPLDDLMTFFSDFEPDEVFCLPYLQDWDEGLQTFGELVLRIEERLRDLWRADRVVGCQTQAAFYELRRAISSLRAPSGAERPRLRPATLLSDCLPAQEAEALVPIVKRRFGVDCLPVTQKVFGIMPWGETWIALSGLQAGVLLASLPALGFATAMPIGFLGVLLTGAAVTSKRIAPPVWDNIHTLGDLTRWLLERNSVMVHHLRQGERFWG
jgi:hypothetical protein